MANCNYCGKPIVEKTGGVELFVSGESLANYCSIDCWTKSLRKARKIFEISAGNICRKCAHIQKWESGSKFFFYCGIRKSKRTENGLLKIKCKDTACRLFSSRQ